MAIYTFVVNEFTTNCYIYKDKSSQSAVIIDPGGETQQIVKFVKKNNLKIEKIVLTHCHYDHIKDLEKILDFFPVEVIVYEDEYEQVIDNEKNLSLFLSGEECILNPQNIKWYKVKDNEEFLCGEQKIKVIHTPGHTKGSISLYIENECLFTGDTLFCGSIGRTDLPTGDIDQMDTSIQKIFSLFPEDLKFFPGHNNPCVLKKEKLHNPFVKI
jgi:glyoxylase-like metal-dependent hydrolase (beta-lactamase superfamily II)